MLHSLFVPHIVVTMLQNWLGLGHAAFVQKSWLANQFVPHIWPLCPKAGSVLAMQEVMVGLW